MTEPLVSRVDHVLVPVHGPKPLLRLFTETLGLPVAWPITDKGAFTSAAACVGNANIEFIARASGFSPFLQPTEPLTVRGIAFEPFDGDRTESTLDARGFDHSPAVPHLDPEGEPMFTNVFLAEPMRGEAFVFFCSYHGATLQDRVAVRAHFPTDGAGPLGVRRLAEIQIGASNLPETQAQWRRFLAPAEPDRYGLFRLREGASIRLRRSPIDGISGIVLEVASIDAAREALRERELLGPMRRSGVGLDYARTGGLDVWLSEAR